MTALEKAPETTSIQQSANYQLTITRIPNFVFFCQSANLPGISAQVIDRPTPFVQLKLPNTKLTYESFETKILLDAKLRAWMEIHDWIRGMSSPKGNEHQLFLKRNADTGGDRTDATLTINTAGNVPYLRVNFVGLFPHSLSSLPFDSTKNAEENMSFEVSFAYDYYDIIRF